MKLLAVINPISGDEDKENFRKILEEKAETNSVQLHILTTTGENDLEKIVKSINKINPARVIAAGGDGTIILAAIACKNKDIDLGIVPMGSANGLASELGLPQNPEDALSLVFDPEEKMQMDMININEEHLCIHIGDLGANARIVKDYEDDPSRGMMTYAKYFTDHIQDMKRFKASIQTDENKIYDAELVMLGICNARKFGTGIPFNNKSQPNDGKFELVLVKNVNLKSLFKTGMTLINEQFYDHYNTEVISCKEAKISLDEAEPMQLDGEVYKKQKTLNLKIVPKAVSLICNGNNPYL